MPHMNGLLPFESTIEQPTETMPPSPKTITATTKIIQKQFTTAATLLNEARRAELAINNLISNKRK